MRGQRYEKTKRALSTTATSNWRRNASPSMSRNAANSAMYISTSSESSSDPSSLNNLGAVCKDGGRLEQALQHFSAALALFPRSHLALKNLAEVHMVYARQLGEADLNALVPPQARHAPP